MTEETTHARIYESDKDVLSKVYKGNTADVISRLLNDRLSQSDHSIVLIERENKPLSGYVACEECGRSENTVEELDRRACKEGIAVNE